MEVLVVREERVGLRAVEVIVPDTEDGEEDWEVLLERGGAEVLVHAVSALEEELEVVVANDECNAKTDGAP